MNAYDCWRAAVRVFALGAFCSCADTGDWNDAWSVPVRSRTARGISSVGTGAVRGEAPYPGSEAAVPEKPQDPAKGRLTAEQRALICDEVEVTVMAITVTLQYNLTRRFDELGLARDPRIANILERSLEDSELVWRMLLGDAFQRVLRGVSRDREEKEKALREWRELRELFMHAWTGAGKAPDPVSKRKL